MLDLFFAEFVWPKNSPRVNIVMAAGPHAKVVTYELAVRMPSCCG